MDSCLSTKRTKEHTGAEASDPCCKRTVVGIGNVVKATPQLSKEGVEVVEEFVVPRRSALFLHHLRVVMPNEDLLQNGELVGLGETSCQLPEELVGVCGDVLYRAISCMDIQGQHM